MGVHDVDSPGMFGSAFDHGSKERFDPGVSNARANFSNLRTADIGVNWQVSYGVHC
jgi:hypothetical protein